MITVTVLENGVIEHPSKAGTSQVPRQLCDPSLSLSPGEKGTTILSYGHLADR